jgi:glycosyltransferase involved in cell wall biosynthesis
MSGKRLSVVLATYERPECLEVVLQALLDQSDRAFDVVVADDGSGPDVREKVDVWRSHLDLTHAWHPKDGFRKALALNEATRAARGDYLVFLDADCVPRRGFVRAVRKGARAGWFLSTKRLMLSEPFSRRVLEHRLPVWRWSAAEWLVRAPREVGRPGYLVSARDRGRPWRSGSAEFVPPEHAYSLIGVFRSDLERVNGFDARCTSALDGEDQDLAIRLRRSGLKCGWAGPASTVFHLWHEPRSYQVDGRAPLFRTTEADEDRLEAVVGLRAVS